MSEDEWLDELDDDFVADGADSEEEPRQNDSGAESGDDERRGGASNARVSTGSETKAPSQERKQGRKRGRRAASNHDDDDFESQPTITKWFRQVPGPLQDVMKQQHADLQQSMDDDAMAMSGRSSHSGHISTVFDVGPWVDMCDFLGIATSPGDLYGGIKMSSLGHTISHVVEDDQSDPKVPQLLALIKSMKYVDDEIIAVFHDPTAEIDGYFHRDIVEQVGPALVAGTAVLLRDVSVFTPTDAAVGGTRKRYLNVIPRNVRAIFIASSLTATMEAMVRSFNDGQDVLIKEEGDEEDEEEEAGEEHQVSRQPPRVFAPADVRTATTELSFISQRQVVQRHQPVRADPNAADNGGDEGAGKKKSRKNQEQPSGLGRWQWQQLAQRKPQTETEDAPQSEPPRRAFTSGRFTELLSQHIQAKRTASANVAASQAAQAPPGTTTSVEKPPVGATKAVRFSSVPEVHRVDQADDDEDW